MKNSINGGERVKWDIHKINSYFAQYSSKFPQKNFKQENVPCLLHCFNVSQIYVLLDIYRCVENWNLVAEKIMFQTIYVIYCIILSSVAYRKKSCCYCLYRWQVQHWRKHNYRSNSQSWSENHSRSFFSDTNSAMSNVSRWSGGEERV